MKQNNVINCRGLRWVNEHSDIEMWVETSILLRDVSVISQVINSETSDIEYEMSEIFLTSGVQLIVDIPFQKMKKIFKEYQNRIVYAFN